MYKKKKKIQGCSRVCVYKYVLSPRIGSEGYVSGFLEIFIVGGGVCVRVK